MTELKAVLIAGPTASGKSALALSIAEACNGVVINADSMQVYRALSILTARPLPDEEARVPHCLYGCVPGREGYSVGRWIAGCAEAIDKSNSAGKRPVIVGGTGLYFKALLEGLSPIPDIPRHIRNHWRAQAVEIGGERLHKILEDRDAVTAARLRPSDRQRLVRALEVLDATGTSLAEWQSKPGKPLLDPSCVTKLVVAPPRQSLYARIDTRFDKMMENGAIEEIEALKALGLPPDLPIMRALGVGPLIEYGEGTLTLEAAAERVKTESRHYAKRQITWLKRNMIAWNWVFEQYLERQEDEIFALIDN